MITKKVSLYLSFNWEVIMSDKELLLIKIDRLELLVFKLASVIKRSSGISMYQEIAEALDDYEKLGKTNLNK